jgi:3-methyl-2-oxobutanoate hydroxymethyltransferase
MSLLKAFKQLKLDKKKITVVTSYDNWSAKIINETDVSGILVGDCSSMVVHGEPNTIFTEINMLAVHVRAVAKGAPKKLIIAAMPFMSIQKGLKDAMDNVQLLIQSGAQALKIEGAFGNEEIIKAIVKAGIPVIGHVGLMPSHHYMTGGFKCQGRDEADADQIILQAKKFEELGAICVVIEAVPGKLGARVTESVSIPVVGVGAGAGCDGQALVLQDMLGLIPDFKPKFVRVYLEGAKLFTDAINKFVKDVTDENFPSDKESYK